MVQTLTTIQGNISIANSSANATLQGKGTNFTTDLKVGDSITFTQ
jgi:hypothetical protein